jgi:D-glycero-alpha-D-manno-heptose-7-phosphate kinase
MIVRAKAPLRISLAGGGTDVSPYCDIYGGAILNATIDMYAYATIEPLDNGEIILESIDLRTKLQYHSSHTLPIDGKLDLIKAVYNHLVKNFNDNQPLSFKLTTYVDAPAGSGLGTSSTLVVTVLGAFAEWLKLPFGEYDIAHLAYVIERKDLNLAGGKQDQYAATFGGFNFMEFYENDKVIVNPLRIKPNILNELEMRMLIYYTGKSRLSSKIIENQVENVKSKRSDSIEAMHLLKEQAYLMKNALLKEKLDEIGEILHFGWENKKKMANGITNPIIDEIYEAALKAGATGGKVSGAGGGGYMMFYCPNNTKYKVAETLQKFGGEVRNVRFVIEGLQTWRVQNGL